MEKEDIFSFVAYILMIGVAVVVGFGVISPLFENVSKVNGISTTTFLIISLIISILLQVICYELSHMLGAKLGKYEILSVNILGFYFYKKIDEKKNKLVTKFKFPKDFDGLAGETVIAPKNEKSNPLFYVWIPFIIYVVEVIISVILLVTIKSTRGNENPFEFLKYFMLIFITVGGMLFVYNYFPAKLESMTDGYRLICLSKKENIDYYNTFLKIHGDQFLGKTNEEYKIFTEVNELSSLVNVEILKSNLKNNKKEDLNITLDNILSKKDKIFGSTLKEASALKLYSLLLDKQYVAAKDFYESFDQKTKDYLKNNFSCLSVKTAILYYGIVEDSLNECEHQIKGFKKAIKKEIESNVDYEKDEFKKIISEVNNIKPTYNLEAKID